MLEKHYSVERNVQILVYLMRVHNVKKVIASPGTTNICFVGSLQQDPFFEIYSAADERSAAYMACGMAAESGEPVALSCTGATASRNYVPGLTEAFYRQLPVLAVTSTQYEGRTGQYIEQMIDRSQQFKDLVKCSVHLDNIHEPEEEWAMAVRANTALLALRQPTPGPVHINLTTKFSKDFTVRELPHAQAIFRLYGRDNFPPVPEGKILIYVGAHLPWSDALTEAVEHFCERYNAVVVGDHAGNYRGKYYFNYYLSVAQAEMTSACRKPRLLIHLGEVAGISNGCGAKEVWRVQPDGIIRDSFQALSHVYAMTELEFFTRYAEMGKERGIDTSFWQSCQEERRRMLEKMPELPFAAYWLANQMAPCLPEGCVIHFGILNSLRNWQYVDIPQSVMAYANTGGFGIDGNLSSLLGASLASPHKLFFGVFGDLAFFYDMNSLGNRHVGCNIRILLVNNGVGTEFKNYNHPAMCFGDDGDAFMAARGHYGRQSRALVRHYAEDLGFEYLSANNKEEFLHVLPRFTTPEMTEKPMLLEVFTNSVDESESLKLLHHLSKDMKGAAKTAIKGILGEAAIAKLKNLLRR